MTKEINLFVGDTSEIKTDKTISSDKVVPKEGKSLFDTLLSNITETSSSKEESQSESQTKTNLDSNIKQNKNANPYIIKTDVKNITSDLENQTETSKIKLPESKVASQTTTIENKTLSLMDRMLLESAQKLENTKEEAKPTSTVKVNNNIISKNPNLNLSDTNKTKINIDSILKKDTKLDLNDVDEKPETNKTDTVKVDVSKIVNNDNIKTSDSKGLLDLLLKEINTEKTSAAKVIDPNLALKTDKSDAIINDETQKVDSVISKLHTLVTDENLNKVELPSQEKVSLNSEKLTPELINKGKLETLVKKEVTLAEPTSKLNNNVVQSLETPISKVMPQEEVKSNPSILNTSIEKYTKIDTKPKVEQTANAVVVNEIKPEKNSKPQKSLMDQLLDESKTFIKNTQEKVESPKINVDKNVDIKNETNSEISTNKVTGSTIVKNENVANELAKLSTMQEETKVNITKKDIEKLDDSFKAEKTEVIKPEKTEKSLLDKLVDESKNIIKNKTQETKVDFVKNNDIISKDNASKNINPLMTNIYLSSQKSNLNEAAIVKVATGKNMAANASNVKDVEKSADFLNLGLEDTEVTVKVQEFEKHTKLSILDKLAFAKSVISNDSTKNSSEILAKQTVSISNNTNISTTSDNEIETSVQLNVSAQASATIETKIIGARQQMGSMMSEVARNMYLNYKPPVTAFKINLMPANLGSIAIIMKSDKEGGLSISLNMSNSATLDALVDNQSALRAALAKNFNTESAFSLDFNMQNQNTDSGNSKNENKESNQPNNLGRGSLLSNNEQGISQEDVDSNYM
ncbi:MAG: flagellar hook-length control protein FliK [Campylobacteraceae bacterium]|nr:flagellar hook-length control protein FliK [Campylobacteraceae bacterium]